MSQRITIVGSANVDFIMQMERLPQVGETTTGGLFTQTYGGKGANQAVAAARAGGDTAFVGCLGDDVYGRETLRNLQRDGIATEAVKISPALPTGSALVMFDRQGDNYLSVAPGANYDLQAEDLDALASILAQSALLVLQMEIPLPTTRRILELAARRPIPTLFNFAPAPPEFVRALPVSPQMTALVVNEIEAERLCGLPARDPASAALAARALLRSGPQSVVLTLGAQGAFIADAAGEEHLPAFAVAPVDTTAAGDVFCGALAVALVEKRPLRDAARFACAASALSVTRAGAQPSIPTRQEIESFLRERPV